MKRSPMLYNRKPQSCASGLTGMTFIHPVIPLKNTSLFILRNTDPIILHKIA